MLNQIAALEDRPPEDRFAGRALAWTGGAATVLGLCLLLVMAARQGWFGPEARIAAAAGLSLALFAVGGRLYEHRGRTDAASALTGAGTIGLNGTLLTAATSYDMLPPLAGLTLAFGVAAAATALCLRWEAKPLVVMAVLGALLAPWAVGADGDPVTVWFLAVAFAAAAGLCVLRDWPWLGLAAFAIVTPQWTAVLLFADSTRGAADLIPILVLGAIGAAAAAGFEVRERRTALRVASPLLLALNAFFIAGAGYGLAYDTSASLANAWIAVVAVVHLAAGLLPRRMGDVRLTALTIGVLLGDLAAAAMLGGVWLAGAWAASTVLFAWLGRERTDAGGLLGGGLAMHASLAVGHVLLLDARPGALHDGFDAAGLVSLSVVAASCLVSAQFSRGGWRIVLQGVSLAIAAYTTLAVCHGTALVLTLAIESAALGRLARREDAPTATVAALGYLALALGEALGLTGGPGALFDGVADPLGAAAVLGACAAAAALLAHRLPALTGDVDMRPPLLTLASVLALYWASIEIVTPFSAQRGQMLLSAFWALAGVGVLLAGLRGDHRPLRIAGLALFSLAAGKVLVYDLAELTEIYRVMSCIALGLLLLAGGFAWQRVRPAALEDLRRVPSALR